MILQSKYKFMYVLYGIYFNWVNYWKSISSQWKVMFERWNGHVINTTTILFTDINVFFNKAT